MPGTRREYWEPKLARNQERDALAQDKLKSLGWGVLTLWECELSKNVDGIMKQISQFLGPPGHVQAFAEHSEAILKGRDKSGRYPKTLASQISGF